MNRIFFFNSEREKLEEIISARWKPVRDSELRVVSRDTPAQLTNCFLRGVTSELEAFKSIAGRWLSEQVLENLNNSLHNKSKCISQNEKKRYHSVSQITLWKYFVRRCIEGLIKHVKHTIDTTTLTSLKHQLLGEHRAVAIHSCLSFGQQQLESIFDSVPAYVQKVIAAGTTSCVDESIFVHYGRQAFEHGQLRFIPAKPHNFGMLSYLLCQRLLLTRIPICLGICPVFLRERPKPIDAALELIAAVHGKGSAKPFSNHLIADALWSAPTHVDLFLAREQAFTVAIKESNKGLPSRLIELAGEDLLANCSRSYINGTLTLQVQATSKGTTAVLSNNYRQCTSSSSNIVSKGTWKNAVLLYQQNSTDELVQLFNLEPHWLQEKKSKIVYRATGWDILRPANKQDSLEPLTFADAAKLCKAALLEVHQTSLRLKQPATKKSKDELLVDIFPHDRPLSAPATQKSKGQQRQQQVQSLEALHEQVRCIAFENILL
jgi:hypothetical protein